MHYSVYFWYTYTPFYKTTNTHIKIPPFVFVNGLHAHFGVPNSTSFTGSLGLSGPCQILEVTVTQQITDNGPRGQNSLESFHL